MQVRILEDKLSTLDHATGAHWVLGKGDVVTVSDEAGNAWCRRGWAEDVSGVVPTGERIVRGAEVVAEKGQHVPRDKKRT